MSTMGHSVLPGYVPYWVQGLVQMDFIPGIFHTVYRATSSRASYVDFAKVSVCNIRT